MAEGMSVRRAALEYNIPKSFLADCASGHIVPGTKSGPPRYLNASEETACTISDEMCSNRV